MHFAVRGIFIAIVLAHALPVAAQTGRIEGQVLDHASAPVQGLNVQAEPPFGPPVAWTTTDAAGNYALTGLPDGTYVVRVSSDPARDLVGEYYNGVNEFDKDAATQLNINGGATLATIDFQLAQASSVSGTISGLSAGESVNVQARDAGSNRFRGGVNSDPLTGAYTLTSLPPGRYKVFVDPSGTDRAVQFHGGTARFSLATEIVVAANTDTAGIDVTLPPGGSIEGPLTLAPVPADPAATFGQMWVDAIDATSFEHIRSRQASNGTYTIPNLPAGSYIVQFQTGNSGYVREVYAAPATDELDFNRATPINVMAPGTTMLVSTQLELGRSISGHAFFDTDNNGVQDDGEPDASGAGVHASRIDSGAGNNGAGTDPAGDYTIVGLRPGIYQVSMEAGRDGPGFIAERWNNKTPWVTGDAVDVTLADAAGIDFGLNTGPEVTGFVFHDANANGLYDAGEPPLDNAFIRVTRVAGGCCAHASTRPDGTYRIQLAQDRYRVQGEAFGTFIPEYWSDAFFSDGATDVEPPAANINFSLIRGADVGTLEGQVLGAGDVPLGGIDVRVQRFSTGSFVQSRLTGADGRFIFTNLPPGQFKVFFSAQQFNTAQNTDYVSTFWSVTGAPGVINPNDQLVDYPTRSDLGAFRLAVGGSISGMVTTDGGPLPFPFSVNANNFEAGGAPGASAPVQADGSYHIRGVPAPATYRVSAATHGTDYVPVYYQTQAVSTFDFNQAGGVFVAAGAPTINVDLHLFLGGSISGRVTDGSGAPLPNISLHANIPGVAFGISTRTDANGNYRLRGLPGGSFDVRVDNRSGPYGNARFPTLVTVTPPDDVSGIDFVLQPAGTIQGRVTQLVDGMTVPVVGLRVEAQDFAMGHFVSDAFTDANGIYAIGALRQGQTFRVRLQPQHHFDPQFHNFISEWWNDRVFQSQADPLTIPVDPLGSPTVLANIDFDITLGGAISGTILDDVTGLPLVGVWVHAEEFNSGLFVNGDHADQNGFFIIRGLPDGQYRVQTFPSPLNYIGEYYDNTVQRAVATPVSVAAVPPGGPIPVTEHIDFRLTPGVSIEGRVIDSMGAGVAGLTVSANPVSGPGGVSATTDNNGNYRIVGLGATSYNVIVQTSRTAYARAKQVVDASAGSVSNVNFVLGPGGSIRGRVYEDLNANLAYDPGEERANVTVGANDFTTGERIYTVLSDASGEYLIDGLASGSYRVQQQTGSHNFVPLYWNNTTTFSAATPVAISDPPDAVVGIDFRAIRGRQISGRVFFDANENGTQDAGEAGIANVQVNANRTDNTFGTGARTAADGTYAIFGTLPGLYRVTVIAQGTPYASEHYRRVGGVAVGTFRRVEAEPVDVSTTDAAEIDLSLVLGGGVSGLVRDESTTAPVGGVNVNSNSFDSEGFGFGSSTDQLGRYLIDGLPPGTYRVSTFDPFGVYVNEIFEDRLFTNEATPVVVAARSSTGDPLTTPVDINLGRGGFIEGLVYDDQNGNGVQDAGEPPVQGARIQIQEFAVPNRNLLSANTDVNGFYRVRSVPPGVQLRAQVLPPGTTDFVRVFWDGANGNDTGSLTTAAAIMVSAEGTTAGIDFALFGGGSISGTILDGNGAPLVNHFVNAVSVTAGVPGVGASTNASGVYAIRGLAAATYRVVSGGGTIQFEVYDNQRDNNGATLLTIVPGTPQPTNINFVLPRLPQIASAPSPAAGDRGTTVPGVTLTATNTFAATCETSPAPCTRVDAGPGVTVQNLAIADGTLTFDLQIAADAPLGLHAMSVVNDGTLEDGSAVRFNAFEVRAGGTAPAAGGERVYVTDSAASQLRIYHSVDASLAGVVNVCCQPNAVTVSPDGNFVYVSGGGDRTVAIVDARLAREVGRVQVDGNVGLYAVAATAKYIYVLDRRLGDRVRAIDAQTWQVASEILVDSGGFPSSLRIDPIGRWMYVTNQFTASVSVVDVNPVSPTINTVLARVPMPAGVQPRGTAFSPNGTRAYVLANQGMYVIDTAAASNPVTAPAAVLNAASPFSLRLGPGAIDVGPAPDAPATLLAYVPVQGNRIWVVDVTTDAPRLVRDVLAGLNPQGVRLNADGRKLFAAFIASKEYYALETANLLATGASVPVGLTRFATSTNPAGGVAVGPVPGSLPPLAPTISQITVAGGSPARNGGPIQITIVGSNFDPSPIVRLHGTGVRGTIVSASPGSLTVDWPSTTPTGDYQVVVTNMRATGNESGISAAGLSVRPPASFAPTQAVYVSAAGSAAVEAFQSNGSRTSIAVQPFPSGLGITPDGRTAFVGHTFLSAQVPGGPLAVNNNDYSVVDLDASSPTFRQVVATIPYVFGTFESPAITPNLDNPNGVFAFAPSGRFDTVAVLDPATRAEVDIDNNPATQSIPLQHQFSGSIGTRLPGITRVELDGMVVDGNQIMIHGALTPDGSLLYVTNQGFAGDPINGIPAAPGGVHIVDAVTRQPIGQLRSGGNGSVRQLFNVAISPTALPEGVFVHATGLDANGAPALFIYKAGDLNDATAFVDRIPLPELARSIAISRDGRTVYMTSRFLGEIFAVDVTPAGGTVNGTLVRTPLGAGLIYAAVAPDDGLLYVTNIHTGSVNVLDVTADPLRPQFVTAYGMSCPTNIGIQPTFGRPRLAQVSPTSGPPAGGTQVVMSGANFGIGAVVDFDGVPATNVIVDNAYTIHATTPAGTGLADIRVTNPDAQFDVLVDRFRYEADTTPPVFTTPPFVVSQTLGGAAGSETVSVQLRWVTNEPSSSIVDYGPGLILQVSDPAPVTNHVITIAGLTPATLYEFRATSTDADGNSASSPAPPLTGSFTTIAAPDVTPPVLVDGPTVSVSTTTATVQWTTNEAANSLVQFDALVGDGFFDRQQADAAATTFHSVTLTGLTPNTLHEYRVRSTDASGNATTSTVATFRTAALPDTTPPVITAGPTVSYLSNNLVIVTWQTNELSTSFVNYGVSSINEQSVISVTPVTTHIVFLTNLAPGTTYGFQVGSTDASGNTVLTADPFAGLMSLSMSLGTERLKQPRRAGGVMLMADTTLVTLEATTGFSTPAAPDTAPPVVQAGPTVTVLGPDRALVSIGTDEAASLLVTWNGGSAFDPTFATSHAQLLVGLTASTTYTLTLELRDPKGNVLTVTAGPFMTDPEPDTTAPLITNLVVSETGQTSARVSWMTNEPATTRLAYGLTALTQVIEPLGLRISHSVQLSGLTPGAMYAFEVSGRDTSGNQATVAGTPFTTVALPPSVQTVTPDRVAQGATTAIAVFGARFAAGAGVATSPDIAVSNVVVNTTGTRVGATLTVPADAAPGPRSLVVTNPDGGSAGAVVTVVDQSVPEITIVTPIDGEVLRSRFVTVTGTLSELADVLVNGVSATVTLGSPILFNATVPVTQAGESRFAVTATDSSGNRSTRVVTVFLEDATPPVVQLSATPAILWPASHQMVTVAIGVEVTDDTDPAPRVTLVSVSSSEPDDAPGEGDGTTLNDIDDVQIGTDDRSVLLRAERAGGGNGRVYTVTYRVSDAFGNETIASVQVLVPHDRRD